MPTTLAFTAETTPALPLQKMRDYRPLARYLVLLAAVVALIGKLLIAWATFGTNDVASFYQFGKLLAQHGLEWTYLSSVAFNHPPLVGAFIQQIYDWDHIASLHENGITFPFLLRLPGIISDFIVVLILLSVSRPLRLPTWSLLVLALSPVSLMISGFHGNTDPVMVMFLVLAAFMCLREQPILCGLFLALSCQIKIIPLLLVPVFLFYWLHRRRTIAFLFPFAASMILLWIQPLVEFPAIFIHRVLFYGSFWGLWGITYWLRMTGVSDFGPVTYYNFLPLQQVVVTVLKLAIVAAVLAIAWRRRKLDAHGLFASLGWTWVTFFIFSPGVCAQYMVWLMPFVLVLSPGFFASLTAASSLFLFFFYNTIAGGFPWYLAISTGRLNDQWLPWSLWPWFILISGAVLLWRNAARAAPALPFCSLASINPPPPL